MGAFRHLSRPPTHFSGRTAQARRQDSRARCIDWSKASTSSTTTQRSAKASAPSCTPPPSAQNERPTNDVIDR